MSEYFFIVLKVKLFVYICKKKISYLEKMEDFRLIEMPFYLLNSLKLIFAHLIFISFLDDYYESVTLYNII